MKRTRRVAILMAGLFCAGYVCLLCPIPPKRLASTLTSPNGKEIARFYWRPCGLLGAVTKDNPYVYMEIRDTASERLILSQSTWGDIPKDGPRRFAGVRPWIVEGQN